MPFSGAEFGLLGAVLIFLGASTCFAADVTEEQLDQQWHHIQIHLNMDDDPDNASIPGTQSWLAYWAEMLDDPDDLWLIEAGEKDAQYALDRTEKAAEYHLQALGYVSRGLIGEANLLYDLAEDELAIADDHWQVAMDMLDLVDGE